MVWRAYYTLRDAAAELSREFKDTYTIADLVHYGAVGIADLCLNVFSGNENVVHIATAPISDNKISDNIEGRKAHRFITSIMPDGFLLIPKYLLKELESKGQAVIGSFEYLKNENGENISPLSYIFDWYELSEIEEKLVFFRLVKADIHFKNVSDTRGEILPPDSSGYTDSEIIISYQDLCITRTDLSRLKIELKKKELESSEKEKQPSAKTTNKQAEIIAALSILFTKTNGTQPYEMAETILQEWQRNTDTLGVSPSKETLANYIKTGKERLSPQ